jgi:hypothetical protein
VLQGQTLVLPVGDSFLYISPIYLQATQARMPQLKKVVLALGNRLIYADSYEEALAEINGLPGGTAAPPQPGLQAAVAQAGAQAVAPAVAAVKAGDPKLDSIRQHLQKYRDLVSQGKMADAGRELDAIQNEVSR